MRLPATLLAFLVLAPMAEAATLSSSAGSLQANRGLKTDRTADLTIDFDLSTLGDCRQPFSINIIGDDTRRGDIRLASGETGNVRVAPDVDNAAGSVTSNQSCYLSVGSGFDPRNGTVERDGFLPIIVDPALYFSYLGFYWGSPDPYNEISFWDAEVGGSKYSIAGFGTEVTGDELTTMLGRPAFASTYVHFDFAPGEVVRRVELRSIGNTAFEADNLSIKLSGSGLVDGSVFQLAVPAPAGLALFALGAGFMGIGRRRFMARAA